MIAQKGPAAFVLNHARVLVVQILESFAPRRLVGLGVVLENGFQNRIAVTVKFARLEGRHLRGRDGGSGGRSCIRHGDEINLLQQLPGKLPFLVDHKIQGQNMRLDVDVGWFSKKQRKNK